MTTTDGPRAALREDVPGVIALVDAAMRQGSDQTMLSDYPLVYRESNLVNVQAVVVEGRPVATAPVLPRRVEGDGFGFGMGVISPTATDPAHQHRGYGAACVTACVGRMDALGLELSVLWTAVATFPFYELNGWQAVERYGSAYRLGADDASRFEAWDGEIVPLAAVRDRLPEVLALHDAEIPGVTRSLDEAGALFGLPKMTTWLALDHRSRVTGYLIESRATNKPGLIEGAGDRRAVAGLIRQVVAPMAPGTSVDLHVGYAPDALEDVARTALAGRGAEPSAANVMLRLNDPAAFFRGIRSWLVANRPADARSVSVAIADAGIDLSFEWRAFGLAIGSRRLPEHVDITRRELTSVIFGPHPDRPFEPPPALAWFPRFHVPIPLLDRS